MAQRTSFVTGSDLLMDGGVTPAYFYGELAPRAPGHNHKKGR